jgi:hypothetical protein
VEIHFSLAAELSSHLYLDFCGRKRFIHPIFRRVAPDFYAAIVERNRRQVEEAKCKKLQKDVEGEIPGS